MSCDTVDGRRFITGLAANDVNSITISVAASANTAATTEKATLENNVFLALLPYSGGFATSAATVTVKSKYQGPFPAAAGLGGKIVASGLFTRSDGSHGPVST